MGLTLWLCFSLDRGDGLNPQLMPTREIRLADELLNRAFELAYFIIGDRPASIYVAMAAMDKLKTASSNQGRRHYYTPTGRSAFPAARTKVNLSDIQLLRGSFILSRSSLKDYWKGNRRRSNRMT
jgi:hypothetical protein